MRILPFALALLTSTAALSQEGPTPTQALIRANKEVALPNTLTLKVDDRTTPVTSLTPVNPSGAQVALLIDDGLSRQAAIQLGDLRDFAKTLPAGTELLIGYMSNGRVIVDVPFTTDHADAAKKIRIPIGQPGQSASPYFCLSEFVKHWPGDDAEGNRSALHKARFVMMITDGVDPYNGSVSITNQDSPYVQAAIADSQRAGVAVSSIYYHDAGLRGGAASFSGQSYLQQVSEGTGGEAYYQGISDPVSLKPFLQQFSHALAETYIVSFDANPGTKDKLVRFKVESTQPKLKIRHPDQVRPGNREAAAE